MHILNGNVFLMEIHIENITIAMKYDVIDWHIYIWPLPNLMEKIKVMYIFIANIL